ncbi:MAG: ORF14 protein [Psittacine adenovirus 12]
MATYSISLVPHSKTEKEHSYFVKILPPIKEIPLASVTAPEVIPFFGGRRMFPFAFPSSQLVLAEHSDQPWRWPCVVRLRSFRCHSWLLHTECVCHRPHSLQCQAHAVAIISLWRKILIDRVPKAAVALEPTISLVSPKCRIPHCQLCRSTHFLLLLDEYILWTGTTLRLVSPDTLSIRVSPGPFLHWVLFCLDPYQFPTIDYPFVVRFV